MVTALQEIQHKQIEQLLKVLLKMLLCLLLVQQILQLMPQIPTNVITGFDDIHPRFNFKKYNIRTDGVTFPEHRDFGVQLQMLKN